MVMELQKPACVGTEPRDTQHTIRIYTTGFAGKSAERFFETLKQAGISRLLDIRTDPLWRGRLRNVQPASITLE